MRTITESSDNFSLLGRCLGYGSPVFCSCAGRRVLGAKDAISIGSLHVVCCTLHTFGFVLMYLLFTHSHHHCSIHCMSLRI